MVKNLTVRGDITPSGTQTQVGGIAGTNAGTIDNCAFPGIVMGGDYVGGIAGKNETGGTISLCQTSGVVRGTRFTGGIAGQNAGTVLNCTNKAAVNTAVSEEDLSSGLEDVESTIYTLLKREDVKENAVTTDTGGVAGYSNGILQSCTNLGAVGYPHVGYNVGGIAGRQNGYMASCVNRGKVQGRKDVGGIVGQMAPDITLQFSSNGLEELQTELNGLHNLIDATLDDAQSASDTVSGRITRISGYADAARDSAHNMTGQLGDFVDSNVDTANAGASGHFSSAMNALADAMGTLREINAQMGPVFDQLDEVLANAQQASTYLTSAFTRLAQWAQELSGENPGSFTGLGDGFGDSSDSLNTALTGISNELTALNGEMSSATTALLSRAGHQQPVHGGHRRLYPAGRRGGGGDHRRLQRQLLCVRHPGRCGSDQLRRQGGADHLRRPLPAGGYAPAVPQPDPPLPVRRKDCEVVDLYIWRFLQQRHLSRPAGAGGQLRTLG